MQVVSLQSHWAKQFVKLAPAQAVLSVETAEAQEFCSHEAHASCVAVGFLQLEPDEPPSVDGPASDAGAVHALAHIDFWHVFTAPRAPVQLVGAAVTHALTQLESLQSHAAKHV